LVLGFGLGNVKEGAVEKSPPMPICKLIPKKSLASGNEICYIIFRDRFGMISRKGVL